MVISQKVKKYFRWSQVLLAGREHVLYNIFKDIRVDVYQLKGDHNWEQNNSYVCFYFLTSPGQMLKTIFVESCNFY